MSKKTNKIVCVGEWQQKALICFWGIFIFTRSCAAHEFQGAMPAVTLHICRLCQHCPAGRAAQGRASFGTALHCCAASPSICSSSIILAEVAGWSTYWGALQRAFKWCSVIYISNICFILSTPPLYSSCMSVLVESMDAKTSFSFEAWDNNKITCFLFMLVIKSTSNYDLIVALTWRLAKGNLNK